MLAKKTITLLVDRLMRLPGRDAETMGVKPKDIRDDLGRAIDRYARTDDHATRAIEALLGERRFRPTEADIRDFCMGAPVSLQETYADKPRCPLCNGNRFVTTWRLVTYYGNSMKIKHFKKLDCPRGYEDATLFAKKIAANPGTERQAVLSAGELCSCSAMVA